MRHSDIEEDMLDKAWGLEQTSRLSCQAIPPIDEDLRLSFLNIISIWYQRIINA
jgi:ferredoxin